MCAIESAGPASELLVEPPLVSVVTPVYNGQKYVAQCIESVIAQSYQHWEYVIVNNKSSDRSLDILQEFAQRDPRIRIFNNSEFLPIAQNHNHALRLISRESKYCKVVHADDWLFPECLARMVGLAEAHPSVGIVASYRLDDAWVNLDGLPYPSTVVPGRQICRASLVDGPDLFGTPTSLLIRSDLVRCRTDFYDQTILWNDTDVCYRLLQGCDYGFVHQVLTFSRRHGEAQTRFFRKFNTYLTGRFDLLTRYGPIYLTKEEYERRLDEMVDEYYAFLLRCAWQLEFEVWRFHREQLAKLGYPINVPRLLTLACSRVAHVVFHPFEVLRNVVTSWRTADG